MKPKPYVHIIKILLNSKTGDVTVEFSGLEYNNLHKLFLALAEKYKPTEEKN